MASPTPKSRRRNMFEPLYDVDPRTGAAIEVFYADDVLARSFRTRPGWFWWSWRCGSLPEGQPTGPFATSYGAYRDIAKRWILRREFGDRNVTADIVRTRGSEELAGPDLSS